MTSSASARAQYPFTTARMLAASGTVLGGAALAMHAARPIFADSQSQAALCEEGAGERRPSALISELVRTYVVYSLCAVPGLVDWAPNILTTLLAIPVVSNITEAIVRRTFFNQFVGADTADAALPLLKRLRKEGKGCLFAYSVEVDERAEGDAGRQSNGEGVPQHKRAVQEMIRAIDVAGAFEDGPAGREGRKTWIAIKMSALLPSANSLFALSRYLVHARPPLAASLSFPGAPRPDDLALLQADAADLPATSSLTVEDVHGLRELKADLEAICAHARAKGVRVVVDAEYSWYQPAIDAYTLALMRRFNTLSEGEVQPLVYQTFQAYLRRTPAYLNHAITESRAGGFALGVKLVRGAYHPYELAVHQARSQQSTGRTTKAPGYNVSLSDEVLPPVWMTKAETDTCYDACVRQLLDVVQEDVASPGPAKAGGALKWLWGGEGEEMVRETRGRARVGVLFGTHNRASCDLVLDELARRGLARPVDPASQVLEVPEETGERVAIAQLYGMQDALTEYIVGRTRCASPFVLKYVPYGGLKEVMPYLSRRAIENKSVLFDGAAAEERRRAWREIWRRVRE